MFDSINKNKAIQVMEEIKIPTKLIRLIRTNDGQTEEFVLKKKSNSKRGCNIGNIIKRSHNKRTSKTEEGS